MKNLHLDHENRAMKYGVTPADMEMLRQRHVEEAETRQALADHNLAAAMKLGAALKQRQG